MTSNEIENFHGRELVKMAQVLDQLTYVNLIVEDQIAVVEINNPPVNVLTDSLLGDLSKEISFLEETTEVRAAIITGAGSKAFVAGADIKQFPSLDEATGAEMVSYGRKIFERVAKLSFPTICAVNGVALGGGFELALACDIRVASKNAKFGLPEVGLGILPGYGGTQRLPRLVGPGKAKEIIFTGVPVVAEEAYRIGLVEQLAEVGEALEAAKKLAQLIIAKAPISISTAKKAVDKGLEMSLQEGLELETKYFGKLCVTEDKNEGTTAFLEKRAPQFKGR